MVTICVHSCSACSPQVLLLLEQQYCVTMGVYSCSACSRKMVLFSEQQYFAAIGVHVLHCMFWRFLFVFPAAALPYGGNVGVCYCTACCGGASCLFRRHS